METNQLELFSPGEITHTTANKSPVLLMDEKTLIKWKHQILIHQQQARIQEPNQQMSLFSTSKSHVDPHIIDPFTLKPSPMSFYRLPVDSSGQACLYFVIDMAANLLLYIGETCQSSQRWKGVHDCKGYIQQYLDLHYCYQLPTAVNIAFWWDVPIATKPRQRLELALIKKWKSPFNKENWCLWGQPFGC